MRNVGFIGAGNMGYALMSGMKGSCSLHVYDISKEATDRAVEKAGAIAEASVTELVKASDIVFLAVKPQYLQPVVDEMKGLTDGKIIASIVASRTIAYYQAAFGAETAIVRIMPNTPALVREGMHTICFSETVKAEDQDYMIDLLKATGRVMPIRENLMDAAMGVSGCGPAYIYILIEAMADAGVAEGLFRKDATMLAAQTVLGAAKMVLETGEHPGALKDAVCSPGGTTIRGVMALEEHGFRAAIEAAVEAAAHKKID